MFKKKSEKAPAGIKCHFYSENGKEYEDSYITQWTHIHKKLGLKKGQQQIVAELLESHYIGKDFQSKLIGTIPSGGKEQEYNATMNTLK